MAASNVRISSEAICEKIDRLNNGRSVFYCVCPAITGEFPSRPVVFTSHGGFRRQRRSVPAKNFHRDRSVFMYLRKGHSTGQYLRDKVCQSCETVYLTSAYFYYGHGKGVDVACIGLMSAIPKLGSLPSQCPGTGHRCGSKYMIVPR